MSDDLNALVKAAQLGDRAALEGVVRGIQDRVFHLAMRILVNPEDARDATQEILILVVTKLSTFGGRSAFQTWVYRVAVNYLLSAKKVLANDPGLTFAMFRADLEEGLTAVPDKSAEDRVLLNELRIACTTAMLLCLDLPHRIAYVLGDILDMDHVEAARVLGVSTAAYRKRLSRARAEVVGFTGQSCGLVNEDAKCSCPRRLPRALSAGRVRADRLVHATKDAPGYDDVLSRVRAVEAGLKTLELQRSTAPYRRPTDFAAAVTQILEGRA